MEINFVSETVEEGFDAGVGLGECLISRPRGFAMEIPLVIKSLVVMPTMRALLWIQIVS